MKKKTMTLVSSVAAIAVCSSVMVGSTYALFTSEDKVNVSVTAGSVDVVWAVENQKVLRPNAIESDGTVTGEYAETTEASVGLTGKTLTVNDVIAGDKVSFDLVVTNNGSTTANYRYAVNGTSGFELLQDMTWTVTNGDDVQTAKGLKSYTSAWEKGLTAKTSVTYSVEIVLDGTSTAEGKTANIDLGLFAVQGNANVSGEAEYEVIPADKTVYEVATSDELGQALNVENSYVVLSGDVVLDGTYGAEGSFGATPAKIFDLRGTEVDLNGNTLTLEGTTLSAQASEVTLKNGNIVGKSLYAIRAEKEATLTLDGVNMSSPSITDGRYQYGISFTDQNKLIIKDSHIAYFFGISTSAETDHISEVEIVNSTIEGYGTALLFNTQGTLNIRGSTLKGNMQAIIVRAGNATISDSTLTNLRDTAEESIVLLNQLASFDKYHNEAWKTGNYVPLATLVVGNHSKGTTGGGYYIEANCTLNNTQVIDFYANDSDSSSQLTPKHTAAFVWQATEVEGAVATLTLENGSTIVGDRLDNGVKAN